MQEERINFLGMIIEESWSMGCLLLHLIFFQRSHYFVEQLSFAAENDCIVVPKNKEQEKVMYVCVRKREREREREREKKKKREKEREKPLHPQSSKTSDNSSKMRKYYITLPNIIKSGEDE